MTGENTLQKVLGYKMADTNASQINLCNITNGNDARTLEITQDTQINCIFKTGKNTDYIPTVPIGKLSHKCYTGCEKTDSNTQGCKATYKIAM